MLGGIFYQIDIRQIKYLNNIVEQDHCFIKKLQKQSKDLSHLNLNKLRLQGYIYIT